MTNTNKKDGRQLVHGGVKNNTDKKSFLFFAYLDDGANEPRRDDESVTFHSEIMETKRKKLKTFKEKQQM